MQAYRFSDYRARPSYLKKIPNVYAEIAQADPAECFVLSLFCQFIVCDQLAQGSWRKPGARDPIALVTRDTCYVRPTKEDFADHHIVRLWHRSRRLIVLRHPLYWRIAGGTLRIFLSFPDRQTALFEKMRL